MKQVKKHFRSTERQGRLNGFAMINITCDLAKSYIFPQ